MSPIPSAVAALALCVAPMLASAGPPPGGGRHVGLHPGAAHRPFHPVVRTIHPGWRGGYWGPRGVVYIGAPAYWAAPPFAWGPAYALPYAVTPIVVNPAPPAQVVVQLAPAEPAPSYWYYCTQPAGYFPYVQNCSQPWMKVVPQLPGHSDAPPQLAP